jgi:hypothetical protein
MTALQAFAKLHRAIELLGKDPSPSNTGLGDSGVYENLTAFLQYISDTYHGTHRPTALEVAAKPAYYLLQSYATMIAYAGTDPLMSYGGPVSLDSYFYSPWGHPYDGVTLDWRMVGQCGSHSHMPAGAAQWEFELLVRPDGNADPSFSGQRWFWAINNAWHTAQNVLTVAPTTRVSYRVRYADAAGNPLSLWSYSNEEHPGTI